MIESTTPVAFSISLGDVLKLFRERGIKDAEQISAHVNEMAISTAQLAEVWRDIYQRTIDDPHFAPSDLRMTQRLYTAEVRSHYMRASSVLGGRLKTVQQGELMDALGAVLQTRNLTLEAYMATSRNILTADRHEALTQLGSLVEQLQERAGELKALAAAIAHSR